jgi:hypothetical protein
MRIDRIDARRETTSRQHDIKSIVDRETCSVGQETTFVANQGVAAI